MNVVFPLRAPFAQMTPESMRPEADSWTRCGNERQRHGCVLVQPWAHCALGGGKQEAVGRLPHTWNVHPNALSARYILSHVASRQAEIAGLFIGPKVNKKERT
jgi:hypothetical protein